MGPYEYVVESINGDYAYLRRTDIPDSGEPMVVAMALLPEGVEVGACAGRTWSIPCCDPPGRLFPAFRPVSRRYAQICAVFICIDKVTVLFYD